MSRAAVLAPPISQAEATLLTRAFSPRPGAILKSIVVDERRRRIDLTFSYNGMICKCAAILEPVRNSSGV